MFDVTVSRWRWYRSNGLVQNNSSHPLSFLDSRLYFLFLFLFLFLFSCFSIRSSCSFSYSHAHYILLRMSDIFVFNVSDKNCAQSKFYLNFVVVIVVISFPIVQNFIQRSCSLLSFSWFVRDTRTSYEWTKLDPCISTWIFLLFFKKTNFLFSRSQLMMVSTFRIHCF